MRSTGQSNKRNAYAFRSNLRQILWLAIFHEEVAGRVACYPSRTPENKKGRYLSASSFLFSRARDGTRIFPPLKNTDRKGLSCTSKCHGLTHGLKTKTRLVMYSERELHCLAGSPPAGRSKQSSPQYTGRVNPFTVGTCLACGG